MARAATATSMDETEGVEVETIVVGVDGSPSSRHALEFALREAELRGATLKVVRAWSLWSTAVTGTAHSEDTSGGFGEDFDDVRRNAASQLTDWVAAAQRRTGVAAVGTNVETV